MLLNFLRGTGPIVPPASKQNDLTPSSKDTKVEDLDLEPWHERKSIKFSDIKRKRWRERRGRNRKRLKKGKRERDRETEGDGFEPQRLSNPSSPMSCTTLASHLPSLNLILHICEVGLMARSHGTEVRKVRIQDGMHMQPEHVVHTSAQEGLASPSLPAPPPGSLLPGILTAFAGTLTQGSLLPGLKRTVHTWTL